VIIGAGGHGKVVADILLSGGFSVAGFVDDDPISWGKTILGLPVLGATEDFRRFEPAGLVIAIGSNAARREIVGLLGSGVQDMWANAVHPRAIVASSARLGRGIVIAAGAVVNPDCELSDHCIINTGATVDHDSRIGPFVHLAPGAHLAGGVTVGEGAFLGIGSVVTPGCSIGEWATIGAGAVVVNDVPAEAVAKGVPARW